MRLQDFPKFRAERIEPQGNQLFVYGRFDHLTNVTECRSWLLQGINSYHGDLEQLDPVTRTAVFQCWAADFDDEIFYRGLTWSSAHHNAEDLLQVADETANWLRTEFQVSDAVATPNENGWRSLRKIKPAEEIPLGSHEYLVEGGWDHEHCFICWDHIDEDEPTCYRSVDVDGREWWACRFCYEKWILAHDVGFMYSSLNPEGYST